MDKPLMKDKKPELPPNTVVEERIFPKQRRAAVPKQRKVAERIVFCIVIAVMAAGLIFAGADKTTYKQSAEQKLSDYHERVKSLNSTNDDQAVWLSKMSAKNKVLENKLRDLKNKEDLARRDLEAYIVKKFRVIPQVVAHEVATQTVRITKEEGVPFSLLVGLMEVESQFKPWAISKKDARGLTQVMPFWIKKKKELDMDLKSKYDLHDISTGIRAGIKVFKYHLKEANNDINQGLYLYVGKDRTYANKVFNAMGRFEIFRSTLDTTLRDEENQEVIEDPAATKSKKKKGA